MMKKNLGWLQRFSEYYYHRYSKWWYEWKSNLIIGFVAISGLLIFYLLNAK